MLQTRVSICCSNKNLTPAPHGLFSVMSSTSVWELRGLWPSTLPGSTLAIFHWTEHICCNNTTSYVIAPLGLSCRINPASVLALIKTRIGLCRSSDRYSQASHGSGPSSSQGQVRSCGICGEQSSTVAELTRVNRFPLRIIPLLHAYHHPSSSAGTVGH